ncbi:ferredoxin [Leifsonia poae]|uniref:Ferredoxin n=1 Tax=Leifsonia poae TaxID=110933 RepID=A0A9W6HAY9_9MICO|nr:ferredoxin [Leifsonia poae]GLJ76508.1 hypothetical protein GCM10017584_20820 [Leifsonia poae]
MSPQHTLHIDWTRCDGRGLCAEILEDAITRDDWGYPLSRRALSRTNIPIRSAEIDDAREAVRMCPVLALKLLRAD